jgi:hypothetical protein
MFGKKKTASAPKPAPDAPLICADGVAESVAVVSADVRDALEIAKGYDPMTDTYAHPNASVCAALAQGLLAQACEFQDGCRMRQSDKPRLA